MKALTVFFAGDDSYDTAAFDRQVREAAYIAEIEEIEKLTEALQSGRLRKTDLSPGERKKGLAILKVRRELVDSLYDGPLPKLKPKPKPKPNMPWSPARMAAKEAGLQKYQGEKPCRRGHDSPRYVANAVCVACNAEQGAIKRAKKKARLAEAKASPQI